MRKIIDGLVPNLSDCRGRTCVIYYSGADQLGTLKYNSFRWRSIRMFNRLPKAICILSSCSVVGFKSQLIGTWTIFSIYILYYRFIVRFPIGLDFLFITFTNLLHLLLSWTSSLSISSSAISTSTLFNHVFLGLPTGLLPSTLYSIHFFTQSSSSFLIIHMSIPSQSTTSNESCDRLNSNQPSQFFICYSVSMRYHTSI